jgi:NDMA-dependent alcohol dehydrogenase
MPTTTRAAVMWQPGQWWDIVELELDDPRAHEVLVRFEASGLCHSDDHVRTGDVPARYPMVGGHEGAGVVEKVGPLVDRVKVGDRIVCSFIPVCGTCRPCSTGAQNLCESGRNAGTGALLDDSFRFHKDGQDLGGMCALGSFSERAVVNEWACVRLPDDIPFELGALVGCGVPTGWGTAVNTAGVRAGQTVVVYGAGGVGINAVQGAAYAGARTLVVVDPVEFKREKSLEFGATHAFATAAEALEFVTADTWGRLADHALVTVGVLSSETVSHAVNVVGKNGTVTITAVGNVQELAVQASAAVLVGYQKRIQGTLFGGGSPLSEIPRMFELYRAGHLKLDELITTRYKLEQVTQGYQDMLEGRNLRGMIIHEHL